MMTKSIGIEVIHLVAGFRKDLIADVIGRQIIRSSTSVGANYRSACRAKSTRDFLNKLKIVEEEADETLFWLELIGETGLDQSNKINLIQSQINELLSILVAAIKTTRIKLSSS